MTWRQAKVNPKTGHFAADNFFLRDLREREISLSAEIVGVPDFAGRAGNH